jgi:UDP-2,4-diacetamido-2,4,6-trideoxy-beta-L-altropyranose hydrolase
VHPPSSRRILFVADAGPEVGGGHVMRCLTLARALVERGAECAFVESRAAAPILRRFGWPAQTLLAMADARDLDALVASAEDFAERLGVDAIVVDHYGVDLRQEQPLRAEGGRRLVVIDDLANRRHSCDLLIDPGYGRRREHYSALIVPECASLVGPSHALVRPEFAAARQRALGRRAKHGPVRRALVALGLTDVGGLTGRVVAALTDELGDVRLDIVLGADAPSLPALREAALTDRRLHLWVDTAEMASLMADADIAIGAGGSSVWERATVGLPSATVILADNQREMIDLMAGAGFTFAIDATQSDFETRLAECWRALTSDQTLRWSLAERTAELCDGQGAERVAERIMGLIQSARDAL